MRQLATIIVEARTIFRSVCKDIWPNGAVLRCNVCTYTETATAEDCVHYIETGWPVHCGQTMLVEGT